MEVFDPQTEYCLGKQAGIKTAFILFQNTKFCAEFAPYNTYKGNFTLCLRGQEISVFFQHKICLSTISLSNRQWYVMIPLMQLRQWCVT